MSNRNAEGTHFGYETYCAEPDEEYAYDNYRFVDTNESIYNHNRKCPKCQQNETTEGHDPCLQNLPGVRYACCSHGKGKGYVMFTDGTVIRGKFKVERGQYPNSTNPLKQEWDLNYNKALRHCEYHLDKGRRVEEPYEEEFYKLLDALLETDENPWSFMPPGYEESFSNPFGSDAFLGELYHSMIDDGEICFISHENYNPKILFLNMYCDKKRIEEFIKKDYSAHFRANEIKAKIVDNYKVKDFEIHSSVDQFIQELKIRPVEHLKLIKENEEWIKSVK